MQRSISVDPTKMGVGKAIAVLTSGGDAQGEEVCICVYGPLWRPTLWKKFWGALFHYLFILISNIKSNKSCALKHNFSKCVM